MDFEKENNSQRLSYNGATLELNDHKIKLTRKEEDLLCEWQSRELYKALRGIQ